MVDRGPAEKVEGAGKARLRQLYPTVDDLRRRARRRVPRFGFDFVDGGANEERCIDRNTDAFQRVELLPHYCIEGKATTDQYFVLQNLCTRIDELVAARRA